MGREIEDSHFGPEDFAEFGRRLRDETALLGRWLDEGAFSASAPVGGFELEAWLVDPQGRPASINEAYLARMGDPLVVPELARFNVELNGAPQPLQGDALAHLYRALHALWLRCERTAQDMGARLAMIGILPTARPGDFTLANMSDLRRYTALNEQVLRLREGCPIEIDIQGADRLQLTHEDVMLESAATSFQIHLKVDAAAAGRYYNASKILSGPMVALSANSPFLFGRDLWDETRVPLFEQAVSVAGSDRTQRVSFGVSYVQQSIMECFLANRDRYPLLLPHVMEDPPETLAHLRLHNGTIWRWNRPLIGFDEDGTPHLRIEHRVVPSGPTVADAVANAAFYFGAVHALARLPDPPEHQLAFETARRNFYNGARHGLGAPVEWLDGGRRTMDRLCLDELLPLAREGLKGLGITDVESAYWLGLVRERLETGLNGTAWQRRFVERNGRDMEALVAAYLERQASDVPVHQWGF